MRLRRAFAQQSTSRQERLARLDGRLHAQHPGRALALLHQRLDSWANACHAPLSCNCANSAGSWKISRKRCISSARWPPLVAVTASFSTNVAKAVRSAAQTHPGQRLKARLGEGELDVRVEDNHLTPVTLSLLD